MSNKIKKVILLIGDIIVLYLSLYLTLLIRYFEQPGATIWQNHLLPFSTVFIAWLLIFYIADLYNLNLAVNNSRFFGLTVRSVFIAGLLSAAFFYINPKINIAPKTNLVLYLIIFSILFMAWRRLFNWSLNTYLPRNNIAVIGYNEQVSELISKLQKSPHLGYQVKIIVSNLVTRRLSDILIINKISDLKDKIIEAGIDTVVLAVNPHQSEALRSQLLSLLPLKINFTTLVSFYELVTGKIPLEAINQMWFLENLNEGSKLWYDRTKRLADIIISSLVLILTAPLWPFIGLAIKLESQGPVFFKQERIGKDNKPFHLVKFRTMREENNTRTLTQKLDPRITKFGNILRKTRIDEVPQVLNIILGHMSFIGPRPERPELIKELEKCVPFYRERRLVKPGATGWDQVSGEYHSPTQEDTIKKLQYDLFYIKNRSVYLDLSILLKTVATVLNRGGR